MRDMSRGSFLSELKCLNTNAALTYIKGLSWYSPVMPKVIFDVSEFLTVSHWFVILDK